MYQGILIHDTRRSGNAEINSSTIEIQYSAPLTLKVYITLIQLNPHTHSFSLEIFYIILSSLAWSSKLLLPKIFPTKFVCLSCSRQLQLDVQKVSFDFSSLTLFGELYKQRNDYSRSAWCYWTYEYIDLHFHVIGYVLLY
jgi:hypothetical protein